MKLPVFVVLFCASPIWTRQHEGRIVGGTDAVAAEYPYAAAIYKSTTDGNYFCAGSLLSNQFVITAGQCVDGAVLFTILLGTNHLSGNDTSLVRLATSEYVLHPEYNPTTLVNDLGLIRFREPISFTDYIKRVHLPYEQTPSQARGATFGWGQVSDTDPNLSDALQTVWINGVSEEQCRITYGGQLTENVACFEGTYNEGACFGDAGSPVVQHRTMEYVIMIAVASFFSANGCESTDPSGYVKVFPYNDWIRDVTGLE